MPLWNFVLRIFKNVGTFDKLFWSAEIGHVSLNQKQRGTRELLLPCWKDLEESGGTPEKPHWAGVTRKGPKSRTMHRCWQWVCYSAWHRKKNTHRVRLIVIKDAGLLESNKIRGAWWTESTGHIWSRGDDSLCSVTYRMNTSPCSRISIVSKETISLGFYRRPLDC